MVDTDLTGVAADWLALVDRGDADASWEAAGASFRSAASASAWAEKLQAARAPLGPLTSRMLAVVQRLDGLPGAPPGEYEVQQYHSIYDERVAVVETLALMREGDEQWRVVGYFIR